MLFKKPKISIFGSGLININGLLGSGRLLNSPLSSYLCFLLAHFSKITWLGWDLVQKCGWRWPVWQCQWMKSTLRALSPSASLPAQSWVGLVISSFPLRGCVLKVTARFIIPNRKALKIRHVRHDKPQFSWCSLRTVEGWCPYRGRTLLWQKR